MWRTSWSDALYSRSSVEAKRLDSVLRSVLYASYSGEPMTSSCLVFSTLTLHRLETLTGLSTVRAYRDQVMRRFQLKTLASHSP